MTLSTPVLQLLAWAVAGIRALIATVFALAPSTAMRLMFGRGATSGPARVAAAHYAARDAVLGAGLARALRGPHPVLGDAGRWMWAGTTADVVDLVAIVATRDHKLAGRQRLLIAQMAMVVVTDLWLSRALSASGRLPRGKP